MRATTISQLRHRTHVGSHTDLSRSELVDLLSGIVLTKTTGTVSTLHVLDGIGTGTKSSFVTNRTCDSTRTMDLHMLVEFVLIGEFSKSFSTLVPVVVAATSSTTTSTIHTIRAT